MTLANDINNYMIEWRRTVPADFQAMTEQYVSDMRSGPLSKTILRVGDRTPPFVLPNHDGKPFSLSDALREGAVVLSFYRGSWCPFCNLELRALQQAMPEFRRHGVSLVAITPELPDNTLDAVARHQLTFPVLSDVGKTVARSFGLVHAVPDDLRKAMEAHGLDISQRNGVPGEWTLPVTATYLIDRDGVVIYAFTDPDPRLRADPLEIIAAIEKL